MNAGANGTVRRKIAYIKIDTLIPLENPVTSFQRKRRSGLFRSDADYNTKCIDGVDIVELCGGLSVSRLKSTILNVRVFLELPPLTRRSGHGSARTDSLPVT